MRETRFIPFVQTGWVARKSSLQKEKKRKRKEIIFVGNRNSENVVASSIYKSKNNKQERTSAVFFFFYWISFRHNMKFSYLPHPPTTTSRIYESVFVFSFCCCYCCFPLPSSVKSQISNLYQYILFLQPFLYMTLLFFLFFFASVCFDCRLSYCERAANRTNKKRKNEKLNVLGQGWVLWVEFLPSMIGFCGLFSQVVPPFRASATKE